MLCKLARTIERTVTTDYYDTINTMLTTDLSTFFLVFFMLELKTAGCI